MKADTHSECRKCDEVKAKKEIEMKNQTEGSEAPETEGVKRNDAFFLFLLWIGQITSFLLY